MGRESVRAAAFRFGFDDQYRHFDAFQHQADAMRLLSQHHRIILQAMLASVLAASERAISMAPMNSRMRSFCPARTCSTRARIPDFVALHRAPDLGIGLPFGFLSWMRLV